MWACIIELYETDRQPTSGGRYNNCVNDVRGTVTPSPAIYGVTLAQWGHVDLQGGSFVSNNNTFTILFLIPTITIE